MTGDENPLGPLFEDDHGQFGADTRFADRLEASLRVRHADGRYPRVPMWRRMAVVAPAMVVLLVVASVALIVRDESPSAALVVTDATNVVVHLPDGSSVEDPHDGFVLSDGAVIEILDGGTATIDGITVDAPATMTVRDGLLVTDIDGTTTTDRAHDTTSSTAARDRTTVPPESDRATTSATEAPTTTREDDSTTVAPTTTTVADRPDRGDPPTPTVTDPPRSDEEPEPRPVPLEISLRVRAGDGGVRVAWNVLGRQDDWRTLVIRRIGDADHGPSLDSGIDSVLADPSITAIADTRSGTGEAVDDPPLDSGPVRYRVLVVDEAGGIVGASPPHGLGR